MTAARQPADLLLYEYTDPAEMVAYGRAALAAWRAAKPGSANERRAARSMAFALSRIDSLGVLDAGAAAVGKPAQSPPAG